MLYAAGRGGGVCLRGTQATEDNDIANPAIPGKQRRICYDNFAEHLLNSYNPNLLHPGLPYRWSDEDWRHFLDMLAGFGFNTFEFWLVPKFFSLEAFEADYGTEFVRQMNVVIEHAHTRGMAVEMLCSLSTVGADWHTRCPNVPEEWSEVLRLWDGWTQRLPVDIVGVFPGDPGGCSRNGCTHETYIDKSIQVSHLVKRNLPSAEIEFGTWGPPFFGWGLIEGPPGWKGEFIPAIQGTAWRWDKRRADSAMQYLLERLPDFPPDTSVAINLGFNPDGNPTGEQDARPWAREIAKTNPIYTWDYSLTEGENSVYPHYRFDRLFQRRREERDAAPYSGGISYTMTPKLNQLSLYESAVSFRDADADHAAVAERFFERLFGREGRKVARLMPLFEIVPDWGYYGKMDLARVEYHARMSEAAELLKDLAGKEVASLPFHPTPARYRDELLFFFQLFADLSGPSPDYDSLQKLYWDRVYAIYDQLPDHVDPRPRGATRRLIDFFRRMQ